MDFYGLIVGAVEKVANAGLQATIGMTLPSEVGAGEKVVNAGLQATIGKTLPSEVGARFLLRAGIVVATHGGGIPGAVLEARKLLADRKLARVGVPDDLPAHGNTGPVDEFNKMLVGEKFERYVRGEEWARDALAAPTDELARQAAARIVDADDPILSQGAANFRRNIRQPNSVLKVLKQPKLIPQAILDPVLPAQMALDANMDKLRRMGRGADTSALGAGSVAAAGAPTASIGGAGSSLGVSQLRISLGALASQTTATRSDLARAHDLLTDFRGGYDRELSSSASGRDVVDLLDFAAGVVDNAMLHLGSVVAKLEDYIEGIGR